MILHEQRYLDFIKSKGVGANDVVSSSPQSYVSYLKSVSSILECDITPDIVSAEEDVQRIALQLKGLRSEKTIKNYCSALNQYVVMVKELNLC